MNLLNHPAQPALRLIGRLFTAVGLGILLSCYPLASVRADLPSVVDQQVIVVQQAALAIIPSQSLGQSFTVGLGGWLTRIDFQLGRDAIVSQPLKVELRRTTGDLPDLSPSALLFSGTVAALDVPVLTYTNAHTSSVHLSSAAPLVTPGEKLVVLLSHDGLGWYYWDNSGYFNSNPYPNGTSVKLGYPNYSEWVVLDDWDFGFRTWVAVPEPSACLPIGLLVFAFRRRPTGAFRPLLNSSARR